ncbi:MAG: hypothetical protein ABIF87_11200 [Pseudomonadota bacterium]
MVEDPLEPDFFFKNQAGKVFEYLSACVHAQAGSGPTYSYLSDPPERRRAGAGSWESE